MSWTCHFGKFYDQVYVDSLLGNYMLASPPRQVDSKGHLTRHKYRRKAESPVSLLADSGMIEEGWRKDTEAIGTFVSRLLPHFKASRVMLSRVRFDSSITVANYETHDGAMTAFHKTDVAPSIT